MDIIDVLLEVATLFIPEQSLFNMSDDKILDKICQTHDLKDHSFDVDSLFLITENIIKRSGQIVDNIVQGNQVNVEIIDEKPPKASFSSPLCTLKSIGCELSSCSCETLSEETAQKSTLSILKKLSAYSWETKAVLALAAFAMEYGEFCLLAQTQQSDLAKSVAILKRVPVLLKSAELQKRRQAVVDLNHLIKTTLQVIECIFELEKYSVYDPKDVPALKTAMDSVPVNVFWSIITVVACATKINLLTSDEENPHDLSQFSEKITLILNRLKNQLNDCKRQIEEVNARRRLRKLLLTGSTEDMEIIKALISSKNNVDKIIDGSNKTGVTTDVLKGKYVLLFFSSLEISDEDISILQPVYEGTKREDKYKIVWIPLVESWTAELRKKFGDLIVKMPWYAVQCSPIVGIKFIKKQFNFKGKPVVVLMNPQGKLDNPNAFHLIRVYGMEAFPFTVGIESTLTSHQALIIDIVNKMHPSMPDWVKGKKFIFFCGGNDNEWIQQFKKKATTVVNDPLIKDLKNNIEFICVGKSPKGGEDSVCPKRFWDILESMFFIHSNKNTNAVLKEVQKLLSYKNKKGWAVLSKGSTAIVTGHGRTMLKVLEDFDSWKAFAKEKGFEVAFKENHDKLIQSVKHSYRLDISPSAGKAPDTMKCPECPCTMETFTSYKCCHANAPFNSPH